MAEIIGSWPDATALGPAFSSQVWSIVWDANAWPRTSPNLGVARCVIAGKYPSILEKWCVVRVGVILICLLVIDASSRAVSRPKIVTIRALNFRAGCIVMIGVFRGSILEVITRPATMLPQASRLIGLITAGLFSLIGERGRNRGWPMET